MKILFDHQIFSAQTYGGISRYFYELMRNFNDDPKLRYGLSVEFSNCYYLKKLDNVRCRPFFERTALKGKCTMLNFLNHRISRELIRQNDYDVFHPTYYNPYFLEHLKNRPFVLTIYDMAHEAYPEIFLPGDKTSQRKRLLAQRAAKIIAISESTKRDIIKFFGIEAGKIKVIHLSNSLDAANINAAAVTRPLPEKYILFVGNRADYKNFDLFIEAAAPLVLADKELNIICAGGGPFTGRERENLRRLNVTDRVRQYSLTDEVLAVLYKKAAVFVFPSLYEGFGMPILEAFACGCPVAAANTSSLPEIAADAAVYFEPKDAGAIYQALKDVLGDPVMRNSLQIKGYKRAGDFSWQKTAHDTKLVYESLL